MEAVANYKKPLAIIGAAAVLLFSGYCLFYKLGNEPFQDYDEATYAEVTHESIAHGNPSALTFLNTPYFRKPPLLFWMTTASERVFHDVEFADRFPSALVGFLTIVLVALVCIEAGAGLGIGLVAATVLATTATWMEFARDVRFDNLVALFSAAAFYAGIRASRDPRWYAAVGIALGLAVLAKSVMALFGGIAVLAFMVYERKFPRVFKDAHFWFGVGVFMLVVLPWHLYMTLTYGAAFWQSYLGAEVLHRASTNLFPGSTNPTNGDYASYLLRYAAPWTILFLPTLAKTPLLLRRFTGRMRSVFSASVVTVLSVLAVAFTAHTKAFGYLIPLYPFLAIAIALAIREGWTQTQKVENGSAASWRPRANLQPFVAGMLLVFVLYAAAFTRREALHIDPFYGLEIGQAYEERDVAALIRAAPNPEVYAYGDYSGFGSILYYSRLPDTVHPVILLWSASSTPSATSTNIILASTTLDSLAAAYPHYRFTQDYAGRFVSLFTVSEAR